MKKVSSESVPFRTVAVIGVGLVGGSLALSIKRRFPRSVIIGYDSRLALRRAIHRRAIDSAAPSAKHAVAAADLVILAMPVSGVVASLRHVAKWKKPGAVVTDVGSVKQAVMSRAERFFPNGSFVGGHPMAGVEHAGIEAASELLFESAVYVLTPSSSTPPATLKRLGRFITSLGARVLVLDAATHDSVASAVSHLPQLAAVALVQVAGKRHLEARRHLQLAAGGFRDLTRIASSRFDLWGDVLAFNSKKICEALDLYIDELRLYRRTIVGNSRRLRRSFQSARRIRERIPKNMKGFLHPLNDIYVFVQDKPGMLARVTGILGMGKVNIRDLELLKVREGEGGTFRISFDSRDAAARAARMLRRRGFEVSLRT